MTETRGSADATHERSRVPKLDLVVTTVGRPAELRRLLDSVRRQDVGGVKVLVADQSGTDVVRDVVAAFAGTLDIVRVPSGSGASRGRNDALCLSSAPVVAFPDDDCWYPDGFLSRALSWLDANPAIDGLLTRWEDPEGGVGGTRWDTAAGMVDRRNIWTRGNTASTFLRRAVVAQVGYFDETIGVGSDGPWQSGEETDFLIRAVDSGFAIHYEPGMALYHPDKLRYMSAAEAAVRGRGYARGMGRVLRLRRYPRLQVAAWVGRAAAGLAASLARGRRARAQYYLALVMGRIEGWRGRTFN